MLSRVKSFIKKYPYIFGLVGILILSIIIGLVIERNNSDSSNTEYTYSATTKSSLPGSEKGRGIVFLKPDSYVQAGVQDNNNANFVNLVQENDSYLSNGVLKAQSKNFPTKNGPSQEYLNAVNETVKNKSSEGYQAIVGSLEDFANEAFPEQELKASLSTGTPFSSNNIPKNAWVFDVTVSSSDDSKALPQTGKLIYSFGANTKYIFLITAESDGWQQNQGYFNNILNSVAIDQ